MAAIFRSVLIYSLCSLGDLFFPDKPNIKPITAIKIKTYVFYLKFIRNLLYGNLLV